MALPRYSAAYDSNKDVLPHFVPGSRWGKARLAALLLIFAILAIGYREQSGFLLSRTPAIWNYVLYSPREGDVVFQSLPHGELVDAIEGVTHSPFSHCGVVLRNDDGKWVVVESIGNVHETPLFQWIFRGRGGWLAAYRLADKDASFIPAFKKALLGCSGYSYDFDYDMDHAKNCVYCSDLVFLAFRRASGETMGTLQRLGDLDWQGHRDFIRAEANGQLPLDRTMITPASLAQATQLHRVY
jgi:hypothetical protein